MIYHFDKKSGDDLVENLELDKMSCIKCENQLREKLREDQLGNYVRLENISEKLEEDHFRLKKFPGFLHQIQRTNRRLDHKKNWSGIIKENSKYMVEDTTMLVVYIKFMICNKNSYATNIGVTTLKSYGSNSLGDLSFSKNLKDGVSKRLIYLSQNENKLNWNTEYIYIIPVCCRRCAYNIEGKLRYDLNLLDT